MRSHECGASLKAFIYDNIKIIIHVGKYSQKRNKTIGN